MRSTKKDLGLVETIKGTETLNLKEPFDKKSIVLFFIIIIFEYFFLS